MPDVTLTFLGAAGQVTGSRHLLRTRTTSLLLDCGLFQGTPMQRERNWSALPVAGRDIDAVLLSHAHLDHSGYLPMLVRDGFRGPVHCSRGTAALARILLLDSARIAEADAEHAARHGYATHDRPGPLFTTREAEDALALLEPHPYDAGFRAGDAHAMFRRAGHILGSSIVELDVAGTRIVFSGDLGRHHNPLLRPPATIARADVLLVEATYGDRFHRDDPLDQLAAAIQRIAARGGWIVMPCFAVGRAQEILWHLRHLEDGGRIPSLPVFLDSPMAIDATRIFCDHPEDHSLDMTQLMDEKACPLCTHSFTATRTSADSRALNERHGPAIVLAGSGMATGGRVLHHLRRRLPDERNGIVLVGFQAAGTRGRALQDGAHTVRIHGLEVPVRAEIATIDGLSAHADRGDLLQWLGAFETPPGATYVVHGEPASLHALAAACRDHLGWTARVAEDGETVHVDQLAPPMHDLRAP